MPSPTAQAVEAILERLKQACTAGTREPTAALTADEHRTMLELHIHDPMAAGVVLQHLREHARTLENWDERSVRAISFRLYERGAVAAQRRDAQIDRTADVIEMAAARNARVRRARVHDVTGAIVGGLSPAQMLETGAPLLVAFALLKQYRDGRIWYDDFHKRTLTDWRGDDQGTMIEARPVIDEHVMRIQRWLQATDARLNKVSLQMVNQIVDNIAYEDKRNAPRDWMAAQQWDGVARLHDVMRIGFGASDSAFNREAGRCWFVAMVARVFDPGCKVDTMPVFIGPQGALKSQALEVIGGEWYRAAASTIDAKDFLQELHGALVFEIQELHSILASRQGAARAKAVLSTRRDNFRLPYGLRVEPHERTAVICGTTNNREWHGDETGGRRYWPVHCGRIHLPWLRRHRAQLFAEALTYWQARRAALAVALAVPRAADEDFVEPGDDVFRLGQWWNVPHEEQTTLMDAETFVHPFVEMIAARLADERTRGNVWTDSSVPVRAWDGSTGEGADWGNLLTVTRIGVQWLHMTADTLGRGSQHAKTIGTCMQTLGFESKQMRLPGGGDRVRVYVPTGLSRHAQPTGQNSERDVNSRVNEESNGDTMGQRDSRIADEEIPF